MWIDIFLLVTTVVAIAFHFWEVNQYKRMMAERLRRIYRLENEVERLNAQLHKQGRDVAWQD